MTDSTSSPATQRAQRSDSILSPRRNPIPCHTDMGREMFPIGRIRCSSS
jgi:hypothetical protein